ncbi:MAG TPA: selenocysteine-specific translation elongation factor [Methylomirabilota bacterium]|nr:selenocysteine-specific translation elongation factor [Methylomirabilota bacterium]
MPPAEKSVIVGTAGHIDHGKSTLVEALTGTHPDRLEEEKRRGITIDLGFAFLQQDGVHFGFVDVPGHERFVRNMLAGAAGVDLVLLVIAADESIKPQTREHFDICRLLGVRRGVVALTKSDLVEPGLMDLVRLEVSEFLRDSFLAQAPIVPVSAKTGAGLAELKSALVAEAQRVSGKDASRHFRLPIDRAFAIKGFGAVVTGTLVSGGVAPGDEVELFPGGVRLRVRGVQSAGHAVDRGAAGQRTAVNLSGIEHSAIRRGMVLAAPGLFRTTRRLDAWITLLPSARRLKDRTQVHFHTGTVERVAEIHLLGQAELAPGESAFAQFRLDQEVLAFLGDRFILRQFSPVVTIGGGAVVDPLAKRPRRRESDRAQYLETLRGGNIQEVLAALAERFPQGLPQSEVVARFAWTPGEIQAESAKLVASGKLRRISEHPAIWMSGTLFAAFCDRLLARVEKFHKDNPLLPGIPREELRAREGRKVRPETFRAALENLVSRRRIELAGEVVRLAGASIALQPDEARAKDQIETAFAQGGLAVPSVKEVLEKLSVDSRRAEKLLQILLREQRLVRVTAELIFHREALADLRGRLRNYQKTRGARISVPGFKELTGITRKYAIPLLEYLDRQGVTRRQGDERVIL